MDHNQSNIWQMAQQHAPRTSVAYDAYGADWDVEEPFKVVWIIYNIFS